MTALLGAGEVYPWEFLGRWDSASGDTTAKDLCLSCPDTH